MKIITSIVLIIILLVAGITLSNELKISYLFFRSNLTIFNIILFIAGIIISFFIFSVFYNSKNYIIPLLSLTGIIIVIFLFNNFIVVDLLCGISAPLLLLALSLLIIKINNLQFVNRIIAVELTGIFLIILIILILTKVSGENFNLLAGAFLNKLKLWITV